MKELNVCYHCGDDCHVEIKLDDKVFCCNGCKMVFEILSDNGLNQYYDIEKKPGTRPTEAGNKYQFLENEGIAEEFYDFKSDSQCRVTLFLPQIHCSSCVWLLENLNLLDEGILKVEVLEKVNQSYLTHLWNQSAFEQEESGYSKLNTRLSKYFTWGVLAISIVAAAIWISIDTSKTVNVVVSILIVGCALALAVPFTFGSA
jgi:hypothetical protein